jgi:hypothetical protein
MHVTNAQRYNELTMNMQLKKCNLTHPNTHMEVGEDTQENPPIEILNWNSHL